MYVEIFFYIGDRSYTAKRMDVQSIDEGVKILSNEILTNKDFKEGRIVGNATAEEKGVFCENRDKELRGLCQKYLDGKIDERDFHHEFYNISLEPPEEVNLFFFAKSE
jgi:hypothetical protein